MSTSFCLIIQQQQSQVCDIGGGIGIYRSTEQKRWPRNRPTQIRQGKIPFSTNGAGAVGHAWVKNEPLPKSHTI